MDTPEQLHHQFRSKICDTFLIALSIFAIPLLASSLWRSVDIGWQPIMSLQIVFASILWSVMYFRKRIAYFYKASSLAFIFVCVSLGGIWSFGLVSSSAVWFIIFPILMTLLFSFRSAILASICVTIAISIIAALFIFEIRTNSMMSTEAQTSVQIWVAGILSWSLSGGCIAIAVDSLNKFFINSLENLQSHGTALEESEREYRNILDNMLDIFYRADTEGNIVMISSSVETIFGYTSAELIGKNLIEFYVEPHLRKEALTLLNKNNGQAEGLSAEIICKNGDVKLVSTNAHYWKNSNGDILGVEGTVRDVTAFIESQKALRRSQKLEVVGQLTGGVAHDFNNLLGVILGNLELLETEIVCNKNAQQNISAIRNALERGSSLTNRLVAFSRQQPLLPQPTNINDSIIALTEMLERTLGGGISLITKLSPEIETSLIDPHQFEDVILNLALNARDAMKNGGTLCIMTSCIFLNQDGTNLDPDLKSGKYILIEIEDEGEGMSRKVKDNAFEPFFSTKDVGMGSGLGLSMVFGFVKQSLGHITIDSALGKGTKISLYLPVSNSSEKLPEENKIKDESTNLTLNSGRVLIVEDDEGLRKIPVAFFKEQGYQVFEASNSKQATAHLQSGQNFELLFTDIILPGGINGLEIADFAKEIQPSIKILLTSGYSRDVLMENGQCRADIKLLGKPYRRADLLRKVKEVFEK